MYRVVVIEREKFDDVMKDLIDMGFSEDHRLTWPGHVDDETGTEVALVWGDFPGERLDAIERIDGVLRTMKHDGSISVS